MSRSYADPHNRKMWAPGVLFGKGKGAGKGKDAGTQICTPVDTSDLFKLPERILAKLQTRGRVGNMFSMRFYKDANLTKR